MVIINSSEDKDLLHFIHGNDNDDDDDDNESVTPDILQHSRYLTD